MLGAERFGDREDDRHPSGDYRCLPSGARSAGLREVGRFVSNRDAWLRASCGRAAEHAAQVGRPLPAGYRDPYTVGYFGSRSLAPDGTAGMVAEPETWLLLEGWKRGAAATPANRPVRPTPTVGASPSSLLALFTAPVAAAARSGPAEVKGDEGNRAPNRPCVLAAA